MGIISPRDFVDVISIKRYEDGSVSSNGMQCYSLPPLIGFASDTILILNNIIFPLT